MGFRPDYPEPCSQDRGAPGGPLDQRSAHYEKPIHPYTVALLAASPIPDPRENRAREQIVLGGEPPSPIDPPPGCVFHTRCPRTQERCRVEVPRLTEYANGHRAACHYPVNVSAAEMAAGTRAPDSPREAGDSAPAPLPA